ncbi:uncharacterized protein [Aquarana catesbeiana]|uniref:uncharacterized protein n=1 Tax=Aquarana catesbeiana TaxID=8400 RepID=UPI003CC94ACB
MNNSKVKVAVRVRPLNQREEGLNSECVVRVSGNQITLLPPISCKEKDRKEPHTFTYDNCFWTEDRHDTGQEDVFENLGDGVLENVWLGYNVCIFAYGQTGSGKTFSMMGTEDQPGIVPKICSALINKESNDFRIEASYFEIYNEEVRDLLRSKEKQSKLRVREHQLLGPYVEGLCCHAVRSYKEIKLLLDQGNKQRAIAETKMNEQSSRSHSILMLTVTQICNDPKSGASRELVSKVSLVDLAGSERSYKSGAQGSQLKECCNINKSLLTLGQVINSLAEISENKRKSQHVKYRDSVLTWLLKNNLGGNSKTIMLATVSPAADNYQETLSTLKYAESAKRIVNQAVVNKDVKSKAIEELKEEIKSLREQITTTEQVKAEVQKLKSQLEEKERLLSDLKTSWEEKLKRTEVATQEWQKNLENMGVIVKKQNVTFSNECYLIQLGTSLSIHSINDITNIGSGPSQDIQISGAEAECEHCVIRKTEEGEVFLTPVNNSKIYVNGSLSKTKTQLWHEDKMQIGTNVFVLHQPSRPKPEHMKTNVSSEAEVQTYDELNTENVRSSILSEREGWNSNMIENEKSKTKSAFYKATESSATTIPASDDDLNSTEKKQTSDMFTPISNESNSQPVEMKVNTAKLEYLEIGDGTKVQDYMVPCSPQYVEASFQTSEILRNSNCLQKTIDLEEHSTLPSDKRSGVECRERLTIFTRDPDIVEEQLLILCSSNSAFKCRPVSCIFQVEEGKWKSEVDGSSVIVLHLSHSPETPLPDLSDVKEFLDYCREKHGKDNVIIVMDDVEDSSDQKKTQILESHPDIEDLYHNLFLFSPQENLSEFRTLLSSLLNINKPPQPQAEEAGPVEGATGNDDIVTSDGEPYKDKIPEGATGNDDIVTTDGAPNKDKTPEGATGNNDIVTTDGASNKDKTPEGATGNDDIVTTDGAPNKDKTPEGATGNDDIVTTDGAPNKDKTPEGATGNYDIVTTDGATNKDKTPEGATGNDDIVTTDGATDRDKTPEGATGNDDIVTTDGAPNKDKTPEGATGNDDIVTTDGAPNKDKTPEASFKGNKDKIRKIESTRPSYRQHTASPARYEKGPHRPVRRNFCQTAELKDLMNLREKVLSYSLESTEMEKLGYNRILLQVCGHTGHGKSSFINSLMYAMLGGRFEEKASEASATRSQGMHTSQRKSYPLTDVITLVDNRGFGKADNYEKEEIYAQLGNLQPLDEDVVWEHSFKERMEAITAVKCNSNDLLLPLFIYSAQCGMSNESKEEMKEFLKNAQKLTGFLPIIILTKRYLGDVNTLEQQFRDLGMERIFPVENYTTEDHIKTPEKDKTFLSILSVALDLVNFRGDTVSSFGTPEEEHVKRVQIVVKIAYMNGRKRATEKLQKEWDKEYEEKEKKKDCRLL